MPKKNNALIIAKGELFGFPTEAAIGTKGGKIFIAGSLETKGKKPADLLQNNELGVASIAGNLSVLPKTGTGFSAKFAKWEEEYAFLLHTSGIYCGIVVAGGSKRLLLVLDTGKLKSGNIFEQFVAEAAEWAGIENLVVVAQSKEASVKNDLLKLVAGKTIPFTGIPKGFEKYELIAVGVFDLTNNGFGNCLKTLTKLKRLQFAVGGSIGGNAFEVKLSCDKIQSTYFTIEDLSFGLQKTNNSFYCIASGTFKLNLDNKTIGFSLSGALSNTSFVLSASSLTGMKIPLNSHISFSDLALSIGVNNVGISFAMAGRMNTENWSIFAGFAITPPQITMLTMAISSAKNDGRITLYDLVREIADINWSAAKWLEMIAIGDFDLRNASLDTGITGFPADSNEVGYEAKKGQIEKTVVGKFNEKMGNELKIREGQLTPLGNDTKQYILTDKGTMRHYRIDNNGKISLNCQVYVCTKELTLGTNKMPVGFFICGTLEIFSLKARFLFSVDKGKSLIAFVELKEITIAGIFTLKRSKQKLPISSIEGGLAGQLIKPDTGGPVMYLNVNMVSRKLEFYLSAAVSILGVFNFDSLVLIKDSKVFVSIEYEFLGFMVSLNLEGEYNNFSTAGFKASVVFDTSKFLEKVKEAQKLLKDAAKSVQAAIDKAVKKIEEAQKNVDSLKNQIKRFDDRIDQCRRDISRAKWYQLGTKIARAAEIAALYVAKAGVYTAMGVANAALEVAKAAVKLGGAVASGVLESLAKIINAVTQLFWIKSFRLAIAATPVDQSIDAELVLIVLGKEVSLKKSLGTTEIDNNINEFVKDSVNEKTEEAKNKIEKGDLDRVMLDRADSDSEEDVEEEVYAVPLEDYGDLFKNIERYEAVSLLRDSIEDLFVDANMAYKDVYSEEHTEWRESACRLTELRWEEEIFQTQHSESFDQEFVESLETVIAEIRKDDGLDRVSVSNEDGSQMDDLLEFARMSSRGRKSPMDLDMDMAMEKESLFSKLENGMQRDKMVFRADTDNSETSEEDANERYADRVSYLLETNLNDKTDEVSQELKEILAQALHDFRNNMYSQADDDDEPANQDESDI